MKYGLKENIIDKITAVFKSFPEIEQAILYGSRATGNYENASDIDITLQGSCLTLVIVNKISWQLDDLLLPYMFDLSVYHQIQSDDLLEHVKRVGVVFYKKETVTLN